MKKIFLGISFLFLFYFNGKAQNAVVKNNFSDSCMEYSNDNITSSGRVIGPISEYYPFADTSKTELNKPNNTAYSKAVDVTISSYQGLSDIIYTMTGVYFAPENPDETIIDAEDYRHRAK